jgi:hypothetical protein
VTISQNSYTAVSPPQTTPHTTHTPPTQDQSSISVAYPSASWMISPLVEYPPNLSQSNSNRTSPNPPQVLPSLPKTPHSAHTTNQASPSTPSIPTPPFISTSNSAVTRANHLTIATFPSTSLAHTLPIVATLSSASPHLLDTLAHVSTPVVSK